MNNIPPLTPEECKQINPIIWKMNPVDTAYAKSILEKGGDAATLFFRNLISPTNSKN